MTWALALALVVAILAVYGQTCGKDFGFVDVDDNDYVALNPHVDEGLTLDGLRWAFTTFHACNWHPLTWLSLQLDAQLFSDGAQGYHRTNVLLHAANTLLLFWLLQRLTGAVWRSAAVAGFFAVHPLHVESVVWVAERKDVLSTLFWLLTTAVYAWYAERPGVGRYLLILAAFALGLLGKSMLVTLPATLLLLDYWPLQRWRPVEPGTTRYAPASLGWLLAEKLPLFALVIPSIVLTLQAQSQLLWTLEQFPVSVRVANALVSYVKYLSATFWPINLAFFYPHPREALPWWQPAVAALLLAGLTVLLVWAGRRRRYLAVGWLWYLGTLVPVIGLVQVGLQAMADRYTYVPSIGLFILVVWGVADLCPRGSGRVVPATVLTCAALASCLVTTWFQVQHWHNSETLLRHTLAVTENNGVAHTQLGIVLGMKGKRAEALEHMEEALRLAPNSAQAHRTLALALIDVGRLDDAALHLERSLQLKPNMAETHRDLGQVRERQGRHADAVQHLAVALQLDPDLALIRVELAGALEGKGDFAQAQEQYEILLRRNPTAAWFRAELGRVLKLQGKLDEALECYDQALQLRPETSGPWNNKGVVLEQLGRLADAKACYRRAVELEPGQLVYCLNLAYILYETGEEAAAAEQYRVAFHLNPDWPKPAMAEAWRLATHADAQQRDGVQALRIAKIVCQATNYRSPQALDALAAAYAEKGKFEDAVKWERKVLELLPSDATKIADAVKQRLNLYERRQPFREQLRSPN